MPRPSHGDDRWRVLGDYRLTRELQRRGFPVNHKKVHCIMRELGLLKKPKHRWVRITESNHGRRIYPNLVKNLAVTGPPPAWVADITYFGVWQAFLYLAVILDLFVSRGYAISLYVNTARCLVTLRMGIGDRCPQEGIIHHSDRTRYAACDYMAMLFMYGFRISMARKGYPYDNAAAESFIKTLENKKVCLWGYRTLEDVQIRLSFFIREVYNRKQLHAFLGYRLPVEFERLFYKAQNLYPTAPERCSRIYTGYFC